jgi:hypothetical protein
VTNPLRSLKLFSEEKRFAQLEPSSRGILRSLDRFWELGGGAGVAGLGGRNLRYQKDIITF